MEENFDQEVYKLAIRMKDDFEDIDRLWFGLETDYAEFFGAYGTVTEVAAMFPVHENDIHGNTFTVTTTYPYVEDGVIKYELHTGYTVSLPPTKDLIVAITNMVEAKVLSDAAEEELKGE